MKNSALAIFAKRAIALAALALVGFVAPAGAEQILAQLRGPIMDEPAVAPLNLPEEQSLAGERAVLSTDDVMRYVEVFRVSDEGQWGRADLLLKQLGNPVLIGHVLAERYLSDKYHTSFSELSRWLDAYGDLPQADKLYTLALKKKKSGNAWPKKPVRIALKSPHYIQESSIPQRSGVKARKQLRSIQRQVRIMIAREQPSRAHSFVKASKNASFLTSLEKDEILSWIANSYFLERVDDKAFALAHDVADRHRKELPLADWTAGLAAWRLGKIDNAAYHFESMANASSVSHWNRSAAAYWAARAHLVAGRPERVSANLRIAAGEPSTFYGLLAIRQLGQQPNFQWDLPPVAPEDYARALSIPAVKRAVALGQVGETARADEEMRRGHALAPAALDRALIALSSEYHLAGAQLHVAEISNDDATSGALYPIPPYRPQNGFQIDRALLYAFMRQESRFKPQAKSGAGASGLMQIMPMTAVHIAGDRSLKSRNRNRLYDPAYNLTLAQDYIEELMRYVEPKGNLFALMVAYNGGPGNLRRWTREMQIDDDPLLFIESIPARETRVYVERVLTNLWLYRYRLGTSLRSLDQVAAGEWPLYDKEEPAASLSIPPAASSVALAPELQ